MKAGLLKKIADRYEPFFPSPWKRVGNVFRRRVGRSWVQAVSFNTSRFSDDYIPRACFEFLKAPGPSLCGFLTQELHTSKGVQHWISPQEHARGIEPIVAEIVRQFRPRVDRDISDADVKEELEGRRSYWPHAYALGILAAEELDRAGALRNLELLRKLNAAKKSPYIEQAAAQLEGLIGQIDSPQALRHDLESTMQTKLVDLRLDQRKNAGPQGT
jgi:hypothetical protein